MKNYGRIVMKRNLKRKNITAEEFDLIKRVQAVGLSINQTMRAIQRNKATVYYIYQSNTLDEYRERSQAPMRRYNNERGRA